MSIQDVMKKSFLEGFQNTEISVKTLVLLLIAAGLLGIYIFFVYRIVTSNTFYSKSFNVSLILMCVITTSIIITIQSSVVVSLGMVGALSIVRFRTAVKDPLDLIFMFWSISVGIICGAGMLGLAIILCVGSTILVLIFYYFPETRPSMILAVSAADNDCAEEIYTIIKKYDKHYIVKSRNLSKDCVEFLLEIRLKDREELLRDLSQVKAIISVSLISNKGEVI